MSLDSAHFDAHLDTHARRVDIDNVLRPAPGLLYNQAFEQACHKGNHAMSNILSGERPAGQSLESTRKR